MEKYKIKLYDAYVGAIVKMTRDDALVYNGKDWKPNDDLFIRIRMDDDGDAYDTISKKGAEIAQKYWHKDMPQEAYKSVIAEMV